MKLSILLLPLAASPALAWGPDGHQIVATIAQMLLTETTKTEIGRILPLETHGHLGAIASWADEIKNDSWWQSWTPPLHYINPRGDMPRERCVFDEEGWGSPERNVLTSINNYTRILETAHGQEQDYALRFLTHYIGDLHQPLHLTGLKQGGNKVDVRFGNDSTTLHKVWGFNLVLKSIQETHNYTEPVPEKQIESALRGKWHDPYIRFIAKEGLLGWWKDEYPSWSLCPRYPELSLGSQQPLGGNHPIADDPNLPVCPLYWTQPLHQITCETAWPLGLNIPNSRIMGAVITETLQLDTPEYAGHIKDLKLVEELLAKGGVQLAYVLNKLFDPKGGVVTLA